MDMKKYLLCAMSLLLLCLICACSKSDETDLPVSPDDDSLVETWVDVPTRQPVSYIDFMIYVAGYGWKETQIYEMNDDATQYNNVPYTLYGWSSSRYIFGTDMMRGFYYLDNIPGNVYGDSPMQYEANKIYVGNSEKFTLISVDDTEIRAIEKAGLIDDLAGGMKTVYHYVVLQRMTDEELLETRDTYWVNAKDLSRPMTREDLIHKWVLMTYTDNHIATHVSKDRRVDKAYIQFFEDGTVTVKDGVGVAAYKGIFDIQFNNNESATISLKFADAKRVGGFFQKNVWQSTELRLTAAAYLTLAIDEGTGFFLQRYPNDDTNERSL